MLRQIARRGLRRGFANLEDSESIGKGPKATWLANIEFGKIFLTLLGGYFISTIHELKRELNKFYIS